LRPSRLQPYHRPRLMGGMIAHLIMGLPSRPR
jgi:hypothetical protein